MYKLFHDEWHGDQHVHSMHVLCDARLHTFMSHKQPAGIISAVQLGLMMLQCRTMHGVDKTPDTIGACPSSVRDNIYMGNDIHKSFICIHTG